MKQSLRIALATALPAVVLACIACVSNQALASTTPAQTPASSATTSGVAVVDGRLVVAGTNHYLYREDSPRFPWPIPRSTLPLYVAAIFVPLPQQLIFRKRRQL